MDMTRRRHRRLRQHLDHLPAEPAPLQGRGAARLRRHAARGRQGPGRKVRHRRRYRRRAAGATDIDIVVNLTVPNAHFDVSLAAIRRGQARLFGEAAHRERGSRAASSLRRRRSAASRSAARPTPSSARADGLPASSSMKAAIGTHRRRHRHLHDPRHGALASRPGVLLQAGRRAGARHRALLHHRAGEPDRPGQARHGDGLGRLRRTRRHGEVTEERRPHRGRDPDQRHRRCWSSRTARS